MKHAGPDALASLGDLIAAVRGLPGLAEPKPGIFYRRGQAFLHFHEDPAGLFADLREAPGADFTRHPVNSPAERNALAARAARVL